MSGLSKAAMVVLFAGLCGSAYGQSCSGQWLPGSAGIDDEVWALAPYQGELVVAGDFDHAPGVAAKHVVRWNGVTWKAMDGDRFSVPRALREHEGSLYLGGGFRTTFAPATGIARWNGTAWAALPQALPTVNFNTQVFSLNEYQGNLVAAGGLRTALSSNDAAMLWNGVQWQSAGAVLITSSNVTATAVYLGDLYIAGPAVRLSNDVFSGSILKYNGTTWSKVGPNGLMGDGSAVALRVYQGKLIIASRFVRTAGQFIYGPLVSWDGATVSQVGSVDSANGQIAAMTEYNGDLIIGGAFTGGFGVGANGVVRWNGSSFAALGDGIVGSSTTGRGVNCLSVHEGELVVGGDFDTAGGMSSPNFARWTDNPTPWVAVAPIAQPANEGLTLTLSAAAASGYADVTYRWQRNGADIVDGAGGASSGGGVVSGASGALASPSIGASVLLTISGVQASDAGAYTVVFSNGCNDATSAAAAVSVNACPGDLNADGVIDDADFTIFVGAYNVLVCEDPSMPVGCPADLNGDGLVEDLDFQVFIVGYDALVCE